VDIVFAKAVWRTGGSKSKLSFFLITHFSQPLHFRKKNSKCPLDDMDLSIEDIFPDNYTKREIEQIRKSFPEEFEPPNPVFECRFSTISCNFSTIEPTELEHHMETSYKQHIDLLLSSYLKSQYQSWDPVEKSPSGATDEKEVFFQQQSNTRDLINAMYERIVVLEQRNREQEAKIEKLQQMSSRRHGCIVWRIEDFKRKIEAMQTNSTMMIYSPEAYTDPNGYKFCARINVSSPKSNHLSLHVHMMKGENDYHLSWPFIGRIKFAMIHKNQAETQHDSLMSKPDILAFHRPREDTSPRGFGYMEYAPLCDIIKRGFIDSDDCLTIKIQMNIV